MSAAPKSRSTPLNGSFRGEDYRTLGALVMAMLSMATGVGFIIPLLPVYAETLGATGAWIGLIFAANPFVRGMMMMTFGSLADYRSKKMLMSIGLVGYIFISLGFVLASQPYHLLLLRTMQGVFSAMVSPIARAYAGDISPPSREGEVMGKINFGFFCGFAAGPIIGGLFADVFGFHAPFYAMAVLSATAFVCIRLFVPEQPSRTRPKEMAPPSVIMRSVELLRVEVIRGVMALRGLVEVGRGALTALLPLFAYLTLGLSSSEVGIMIALRALISALMQRPFGRLADRYNRKWLALLGFSLAPVGFVLLPLSQNVVHLVLVSVLLGMSNGISVPATFAIAVDQGRRLGMGRVMGLEAMVQSFFLALGSTLGGAALDFVGMTRVFQGAAGVCLLGIALSLWWLRAYRPIAQVPANLN